MKKWIEHDENVLRCRRAREAIVKRCKTLEGLFEYLKGLEKARSFEHTSVARRKSKPTSKLKSKSKQKSTTPSRLANRQAQ